LIVSASTDNDFYIVFRYLDSKNIIGRGIDAGFGKIKNRKRMLNNCKEEIYSGWTPALRYCVGSDFRHP